MGYTRNLKEEIKPEKIENIEMFYTRQPTLFNMDPMFYRPVRHQNRHQPVRHARRNSPEKVFERSPEESNYIEIPIQRTSVVDEQVEIIDSIESEFYTQQEIFNQLDKTPANKPKLLGIGEMLMRLLERLDQLEVKSTEARLTRKNLVKNILSLQDTVDSIIES